MQELLKNYMVEHSRGETKQYSLTCAVCGTVWKSTTAQVGNSTQFAVEEAKEHNRMCTFCGRPVCLHCFEDVKGIALCTQCGQRLRERLEQT